MKTATNPARRSAKPRHTFAPTQTAYFAARVAFEALDEAFKATAPNYGPNMDADACDAIDTIRDGMREACGWYAAKDALLAAEIVMVKWSMEHAKAFAAKSAPEHVATIEDLMSRARRASPAHWTRLVDIAGRLAA